MPTKYDPRRKKNTDVPATSSDLTALTPEQDFSPVAAARRDLVKSLDYADTMRGLNRQYTAVSQQPDMPAARGASPKNLALSYYTQQINEVKATEAARQAKIDLAKYPAAQEIVRAAAYQGQYLSTDDLQNLVDFSVLNDAADTIIAGINPEVGDPNVTMNVATTLAETNPVAAGLLFDVVQSKLAETVKDPSVLENLAGGISTVLEAAFAPFVAAWEYTAQGVEAGNYAAAQSGRTEFTWPNQIAGFFSSDARAAVAPGKLDEDYIQQLREATNADGTPVYTPLQIEIVTELVRRQSMGDVTPLADLWQSKYAGNLEAAQVFGDLAYNRSTGNTQELYRQVMSANPSNLGQSMLGAAGLAGTEQKYDPFRGTETRANIADVTGFVTGIAIDPTNLAFGAGRAFQAARWSLTKLAPGAGEAASVLRSMRLGGRGFEFNPAYRYFDQFTQDLNKYDDLRARARTAEEAGNTDRALKLRGNAADLRNKMARQYDEMPEKLVDDFYKSLPRNADGKFDVPTLAAWIDDTNDAYLTTLGEVAPKLEQLALDDSVKRAALLELIDSGDAAAAKKAAADLSALDAETGAAAKGLQDRLASASEAVFTNQVGRTTQRQTPLIPRMSAVARMRKDAVNSIRVSQMSSNTVDRMIAKYLPSADNADQFAEDLSRNAEALGFDVRSWRAGGQANPLSAPVDALGRLGSSLPDVGRLALVDASSTKPFYRMARQFFPKRLSRVMADQWREASPGARRKMLNGMVRSAAAVRGIRLTDDELAAFMGGLPNVNDLATGTRIGEQYAVRVVDGVLPSERAAQAAGGQAPVGSGSSLSLSADANGIEHALHLEDTADYVRIPSLRDFEDLRKERSLAMQGYYYGGRGVEHVTNAMSFLTLYGLRFSLRNAIEEDGLFLFMGGGLGDLAKGRQIDQAVRRATPRLLVKIKDGQPQIVAKSSLGMFANKAEWISARMRDKGMPEWLNEMVYSSVDRKAAEAALAAKKAGDPDAYANLVVQAEFARRIGRRGFTMLNDDDRKMLRYFAESSHGQALYDEVAGGAAFLQNAALPNFAADADMLSGAIPGVTLAKLRNPKRMTVKGYGNVAPIQVDQVTGARIMGVTSWWETLRKTLDTDGPIGEAAVRLLTDPAKAKQEIARIIREDTEFGYAQRFSRITDEAAVYEFANSYFENVFQHFTKADGTLNLDLRSRFLQANPETGKMEAVWWRQLDEGEQTYRVRMSDLEDIAVTDRPSYVFGPQWSEDVAVPVVESEAALLTPTRGYDWMARQNTRISRGPIFHANLLNAWRESRPMRDALAQSMARGAGLDAPTAAQVELAERLTAKQAMDQAYNLTLSYVDNPANRSNLAWKARNVSRYYRATEDFWRRMKRVAANKPETFWRLALTYQLATDTGFVYQDDEGTAYFGYPGNEQLNQAISAVGLLFNLDLFQYAQTDPFFIAGKVSGSTPSTDLMQQAPSAFGVTAVGLTGLYSAFPALYKLKGLQKLTLGQYANVTGNPITDMLEVSIPPVLDRLRTVTDPEQFDATMGQAAFDTLAILAAEGLLDEVTIDGKKLPATSLTATQFMQSEEWAASQKIALANVITRTFYQFAGPAAPQQYQNNVSKIARDLGVMGMKPLFYSLLDANKDASDPFAAAYSQFMAAQVKDAKEGKAVSLESFLPFTLGTHKSPTDTPDRALAALSKVRAGTDTWLQWWESDNTKDLVSKGFKLSAYYLAPRQGEFDWVSWQLAKNDLGLKVKKSDEEMIMDLIALNGEHTDSQIRAAYDELLVAQDPNTPEGKEAIKALNESKELDMAGNKILNPAWDVVSGQRNSQYTDANYRAALGGMRDMLEYMRERDGRLSGTALNIDNAINIYLHYQQQISGLTGPGPQREAEKKGKKAEMDAELAVIKQMDENAAVFIESVIDNVSYKPEFPAFGAR